MPAQPQDRAHVAEDRVADGRVAEGDERELDDAAVLNRLEGAVPEDTVVMHPVESAIPEVLDAPLGLILGSLIGLFLWTVLLLGGLFALKVL